MSDTFKWCKDKTKLGICDKQVFCVNKFGTKYWFLNGELHRVDGPAVEFTNGTKWWYLNGKIHRENGHAVEYASGAKYWCLNGKQHRVNGPAIEYANGDKYWYLNGKRYSESEYWKELNK